MANKKQTPKEMNIFFPEHLRGGVYANSMYVTHSRDEFILDFMVTAPFQGAVTARVIVSPGHMKRIIRALQENVNKYEKNIGKIAESKATKKQLGFSK